MDIAMDNQQETKIKRFSMPVLFDLCFCFALDRRYYFYPTFAFASKAKEKTAKEKRKKEGCGLFYIGSSETISGAPLTE
jgi:hypothetical protein